jgi:hypothetical protein
VERQRGQRCLFYIAEIEKFLWAVLTPQSSEVVPSCVSEALESLYLSGVLCYIINSLNSILYD